MPEPGHTDAGRTYLTQATPERAQGTYLGVAGVLPAVLCPLPELPGLVT